MAVRDHSLAEQMQIWCEALRLLMSDGAMPASLHDVAFCAGGAKDAISCEPVLEIARSQRRDVVYLTFCEDIERGPVEVSMAIRAAGGIHWISRCLPYSAGAQSPTRILGQRLFALSGGSIVDAGEAPSPSMRRLGVRNASMLWSVTADGIDPDDLVGGKFIPAGEPLGKCIEATETYRW